MTSVRPPVRVLLVDDSDVYRGTLEFVLGRRDDVAVVASVGDGTSAARACAEHEPDVVILDYRLPDLDGPDVAAAIRERGTGAAVVFLSASAGAEEREAARIARARLVGKDEGIEALLQAVLAAASEGSRDAADD